MGNLIPGKMFTHTINAVKGWPSTTAVDKSLALDDATDSALVFGGSVGHVDATSGKFVQGVGDDDMALFVMQNANDFDVNSDVGGTSGGVISALVACGSYELQTTEFDASGTYAPNTLLTAATGANLGKVVNTAAPYAEAVIGVVSQAVSVNSNKVSIVSFWPVYLPKT